MVKYLFWPLPPWNLTLAPQHEESDAQEEYIEPHYDPVIAAVNAWGDDGAQPVRYDPIAAAQDGWGDDGTVPVRIDPVAPVEEVGGDEANNYPEAEAQEHWGDDGGPTEEVAPPVEVTPLEEVAPPEEVPPPETPAAESPIDAAEEEATPAAAAAVDDEEGQVTGERKMERCIRTKNGGCIDFWSRRFEHGVLERNR